MPTPDEPSVTTVLVLGATGYVGGRLVPLLLEAGVRVRAVSRSISKLRNRPWANHPNVELMAADALDADAVDRAVSGCSHVYYLVHSMNATHHDHFEQVDRTAACLLRDTAARHNVQQIIYLSGLGVNDPKRTLSPHLRSRTEVALIMSEGPTPLTVLRAAMIIGSGSASFEILRYIVERLPAMITPKWVDTPCQPIAIRNVLQYLMGCLNNPATFNDMFDIGGDDILTYAELMNTYARCAGLRPRWIVSIPFFTTTISSWWIGLVTPVPNYIARPLAEGLRNPVVCQENRIRDLIVQKVFTAEEAINLALLRVKDNQVTSHWTDAGEMPDAALPYPGDPDWSGGTYYQDNREIIIEGRLEDVWQPVVEIGGASGYYSSRLLWQIRGAMDLLFGGVGYGRGRKDQHTVSVGDALDCWRVIRVEPPERLHLKAEMKVPGEAYLQYRLRQVSPNRVALIQSAMFIPKGLLGLLYWWAVSPVHNVVFDGMLSGIAKAAPGRALSQPETIDACWIDD
ncbi:MAG: SDR family oxidoreductase [Cyanobacteria bacterium HKST-UBA06]|nr:SDR family oxidoreductase [Cyanobacteria bacterium HKST-UBA06]